ncbi:carbohydrate kinase family protein [Neorhizobium sp. BT27B]|uniref:carbohydrate kinase family protein n=1 Tax=Neorhizobium sp. BT27B TaxID=3142625 RepID=UPI003D277640
MSRLRKLYIILILIIGSASSAAIIYFLSNPAPSLGGLGIAVSVAIATLLHKEITDTFKKNQDIESTNDEIFNIYNSFYPKKDNEFLNDVLVITANNYDYFFTVSRQIKPNREMVALTRSQSPGGSGANTAYLLGRLDRRVSLCGVLGTKSPGDELQKDLDEARIDTSLLVRMDEKPGETIVLVDNTGSRFICVSPGANLRAAGELSKAMPQILERANNSAFVHISSFVQEADAREGSRPDHDMLPVMRQLVAGLTPDVICSFVPGDLHSVVGAQNDYNELMISRADIIFLYEHQLMYLLDGVAEGDCTTERLLTLVDRFLTFRSRLSQRPQVLLCIKRPERQETRPTHPMHLTVVLGTDKIVKHWDRSIPAPQGLIYRDGTGAGDAAAAGIIDALLSGKELSKAVDHAAELSYFIASEIGTRTGITSYLTRASISNRPFTD